jgi:DNA-binding protein YbaB
MDFDGEMLERELREVEARARQAREELSALVVEAKSKDGLIELTVGSQGRLHALTFDPRVKRLPVEELAKRVVEMMNDALDLLLHETAAKTSAIFPDFTADPPFGDPSR